MSWRVVVIKNRAKLDLKLNTMVVRGDETFKLSLSEISTVVIENTSVSITAALLNELIKQKIKVIFCDEKRNPSSELLPYYGSHDTSAKIRTQIKWNSFVKGAVWTEIVRDKINKQRDLLRKLEKEEYKILDSYLKEISFNDESNREAHASKVYFNALFGLDFTRSSSSNINNALNYGYSILLSAFNREIVICGYLTQIGIFHDNMFNKFNLGSDFMEPFRPIVDELVYNMELVKFESEEKLELLNILNLEIKFEGKRFILNNAIKIYCNSVFTALNEEDSSCIKFYESDK